MSGVLYVIFNIYLQMNTEFEIYPGKSYNNLIKDIVDNSQRKQTQIDKIINDLVAFIKCQNDGIMLSDTIQRYLDLSVKNDDLLIKLAAVCQRHIAAQTVSADGTSTGGVTDLEKEELLRNLKNLEIDVNLPFDTIKKESS